MAFDWFIRLQIGSIKIFSDLESLFMAWFFNDDIEVTVLTLLLTKQQKDEPGLHREIQGRGPPMSQRHANSYLGADMLQQLSNENPHQDRPDRVHNLVATAEMAEVAEVIIARRCAKSGKSRHKSDRPLKCFEGQSFQTDKKEGSTSAAKMASTSQLSQAPIPPKGSPTNLRGARGHQIVRPDSTPSRTTMSRLSSSY